MAESDDSVLVAFGEFVKANTERIGKVIRAAGIKAES